MKFEIVNGETPVEEPLKVRLTVDCQGDLCFQVQWPKSNEIAIHCEGMDRDGWSNLCWIRKNGYFAINSYFENFETLGIRRNNL